MTIGNFDGVHRGHQAMLARLVEAAEDLALTPAVLTFDPHPRAYFSPRNAPPRVVSRRRKLALLREAGVARTIVARFDARLAAMSAEDFVDEVLVRRLRTRWMLVGDDFRFGKGRRGDLALLRARSRSFSVEAMATLEVDGQRVSSSAVREALAKGELARATALLGRPYVVEGRVIHGRRQGRALGFPTANIALPGGAPASGIFVVRVRLPDGRLLDGVASIGVRPTVVDDGVPLLEVYLFDFDEPLYGRRLEVELLAKLRDEARFESLDALKAQIADDVAKARAWFARHPHP